MSKFDKTINLLLNKLIFEQTDEQLSEEEIQKASEEINQTRQKIKEEFDRNPTQFIENAESNINAYNYVVDGFTKYFGDLYEKYKKPQQEKSLNENSSNSDWLEDLTAKVTDYATQTAKTAGGYIQGGFENVLDFLTDTAVENMPSIMKGIMGGENYDAVRSEVDQLDDRWFYKVVAIFDPTGILSWTYLENAKRLYEENLGKEDEDIYTLNLLAAAVAVIPGISALKIFTVPFKILSPLKNILGGERASSVARAVAKELKGALNIGQEVDRAVGIVSRTGRVGERLLNFAKAITKPVKPIAKLAASAAKAGTVVSGGDIPKMVDDWSKKGAEIMARTPQPQTLGRIPSFQRITTQR